jgi:hypothetical protein
VSQDNVEIVRKGIEAWNQRDAELWLSYARFRVEAPGHDSEVAGYAEARALAHQLAAGLE